MDTGTKATRKQEAIKQLQRLLKDGDTVYTIVKAVARSGMSRNLDAYCIATNAGKPPHIQWIGAMVAHAIDTPQSRGDWEKGRGFRVNGCGMDMGFAVVRNLSAVLGLTLNQAWL